MDKSTPVSKHGQLKIAGNTLLDEHDKAVQLRGMSLYWSQWMAKFWNQQVIAALIKKWNISLIRAPMGVELGGYLEHPAQEKEKMCAVIDAAIDHGIYIIVDWHDHHANDHLQEAVDFFSSIASQYHNYPNIIYEIFNEPLDISWQSDIKPYAQKVIKSIRNYDPSNIILTGTPKWSQDVDVAAVDPLDGSNLAYTLHFYATSHKIELRKKAEIALNKGIALIVSEWGSCHANGNGEINYQETEFWLQFMDKYSLSWCNWSICDKYETSSAFKHLPKWKAGISRADLAQSGLLMDQIFSLYQ